LHSNLCLHCHDRACRVLDRELGRLPPEFKSMRGDIKYTVPVKRHKSMVQRETCVHDSHSHEGYPTFCGVKNIRFDSVRADGRIACILRPRRAIRVTLKVCLQLHRRIGCYPQVLPTLEVGYYYTQFFFKGGHYYVKIYQRYNYH